MRPAETARPAFADSPDAFEEELNFVCRTLRRMGARPSEAEDLAQDVFLVVWRRWADFEPEKPLRAWLAGIAQNVALDHFRRHSRREVATVAIEQEDHAPGPEDQLASARARRLTLRALASLPERHRAILIRHEFDGVSMRELADDLAVPFFTVASRIRRARQRFEKAVKELQKRGGRWAGLGAEPLFRARPRSPGPDQSPLPTFGALVLPVGVVIVLGIFLVGVIWTKASPGGLANLAAAAVEPPASALKVPMFRPAPRPLPPPRLLAPPSQRAAVPPKEPEEDLVRGLIGHWRFEDGPGSPIAKDGSGRGHPCLLHGVDPVTAWVPGKVGGAVDLGRTGFLECPMPEARAGVPFDLSVAAWMKRREPRRESALFTRQLPSFDNKPLFWFGLWENRVTVWSRSWVGWTSSRPRQSDTWTHVTFVHSGSETRVYVDGVLTTHRTGQLPRGADGVVTGPLIIGGMRFGTDPLQVRHHFDGLVDEALVYDRPLTDAQVAALAKLGAKGPTGGPGSPRGGASACLEKRIDRTFVAPKVAQLECPIHPM